MTLSLFIRPCLRWRSHKRTDQCSTLNWSTIENFREKSLLLLLRLLPFLLSLHACRFTCHRLTGWGSTIPYLDISIAYIVTAQVQRRRKQMKNFLSFVRLVCAVSISKYIHNVSALSFSFTFAAAYNKFFLLWRVLNSLLGSTRVCMFMRAFEYEHAFLRELIITGAMIAQQLQSYCVRGERANE